MHLSKSGCGGKTQKGAKLMALGPGSGWLVGNKAINLAFWAPFLSSFLLALKERTRIIKKVTKEPSPKGGLVNTLKKQ